MDSFKLLTRSAKLKPQSAGAKPPAASTSNNLPSAGEAANPQLFSHAGNTESDGNRGTKRKRGAAGNATSGTAVSAGGDHASGVKSTTDMRGQNGEAVDDDASGEAHASEQERKSALKSHKIRVTDLRTPANATSTGDSKAERKERKKRKKKNKTEEKDPVVPLSRKQKKAAQQIYPHPLTKFAQLRTRYNISRRLGENILNQGYTMPTEVQLGSLPLQLGDCPDSAARSGKREDMVQALRPEREPDLLVIAPTGSGKTLAFLVPLVNNIMRYHHQDPSFKGMSSIVVAPTKELVGQIVNEGRKLTAGTGVKVTAMRKGMRLVEDRGLNDKFSGKGNEDDSSSDDNDDPRERSAGVPVTKSGILVSTPLLLVNALSDNGTKDIAPLRTVRNLVLDEADVLLDPLFRDQTLEIWRACPHPQLRVGLWSATMGSNIEELSKSTIRERQVHLGMREESSLVRLVVGLKDSAIPNISHKLIYAATEQGKLLGLRQLLHPTASTSSQTSHLRPPFLVFAQTITRAVALHSELMYDIPPEAGGSSRIAVLHAELSDSRRSDVMAGFRKGEIWILITTDLLARGVDFRGINGVVNYDIPNSSAAYVHRVGRTGRAGREGGVAVTYYTKEDIPYVKSIANAIAASDKVRGAGNGADAETEKGGVQKWLLDALPDLSKKDRKELKQHGVEARRPAGRSEVGGKEKKATRISTKSGYERRVENNRKGAVKGSKRRNVETKLDDEDEDEPWSGIED